EEEEENHREEKGPKRKKKKNTSLGKRTLVEKNSRKIAHRTGSDYENGSRSEVGWNHKNNEEEENLKELHPSTAGFPNRQM
ncbi:hypothetical protein NPIL_532441, partial [Nephila pilipes]